MTKTAGLTGCWAGLAGRAGRAGGTGVGHAGGRQTLGAGGHAGRWAQEWARGALGMSACGARRGRACAHGELAGWVSWAS